MSVSASLVISFYNRIDLLKIILAALERQRFTDFEVIIADDGSKEAVVSEIKALQQTSKLVIQHVWHEDKGFRKTRILNEAIRKSQSEYLIFIDGDCIPHSEFIREHYINRKPGVVLAGRRANLSPRLQRLVTEANVRNGILEHGFSLRMIWDGITGKSNHIIKGLYFKNRLIRRFLNRAEAGVLGCNFSLHKSDMLAVNGFDERYEAPTVGEDTDLEARLRWNGVRVQPIKNMAVQYHFDHPKLSRETPNKAIFETVLKDKKAFTPFGISRES